MDSFRKLNFHHRAGLVLALLAVFGALLGWYAYISLDKLQVQKTNLHQNALKATAGKIQSRIEQQYRMVAMFVDAYRDLLGRSMSRPDDVALRLDIKEQLSRRFPDMYSFALAAAGGEIIVKDGSALLDKNCIYQLKNYAINRMQPQLGMHAHGEHAHYALLAPLPGKDKNTSPVMLISFSPNKLINVIKQSEAEHNAEINMQLVHRKDTTPVVLGDDAPLPVGNGDTAYYYEDLPRTDWQLIGADLDNHVHGSEIVKQTALVLYAILIVAAVAVYWWLMRYQKRVEKQNQLLDRQSQKLKLGKKRMRLLQETTVTGFTDEYEKIRSMIRLGLSEFGLDIGLVSCIEEENYRIFDAVTPSGELTKDMQFPLGDTFCKQTIQWRSVFHVHHAAQSPWAHLPCYKIFRLEAYIGAVVYVRGETYGTVSFSSSEARKQPFSEEDIEFVQLIAQWIGFELERIDYEHQSQKKNRLLSAITAAQSHFIADVQYQTLFDDLLTDFLALTDSEYGFIGEILEDKQGEKYLKSWALTNIAWNDETRRFYDSQMPYGLEFRNLDTLFGYSVKNGEVVISNSPDTDHRRGGIPKGHPPIKAYLGVPFYHGGKMVGMAGLANRPGGYDMAVVEFMQPLFTACGAIIWACQNEIKRANAEKALWESQQRFDLAVSGSSTGLWDWDVKENQYWFSPRYKSLLGYGAHDIKNKFESFGRLIHPEDKQKQAEAVQRHLKNQEAYDIEYRMLTQHGEYRWFRDRGQALWDASGEAVRMAGSINDISDRKKVENMKNEFISMVSHELRTPLTSIRGALGLMDGGAGGALPPQAQGLVAIANKSTERLILLINDILDISKIESGKMQFHFNRENLRGLLEQAIEENHGYGEQYGVIFKLTQCPGEMHIVVDSAKILQVMNNLLSNAAKFSAKDSVVEVSAVKRGGGIRVAVSDAGPGIPDEFREQVFEKFAQADTSDTRASGGTGLGLNISRLTIEKHGGRIDFISHIGKGTTFYFDLPEDCTDEQNDKRLTSPVSQKRLMVVTDHNHDVLHRLHTALAQQGFDCQFASSDEQVVHSLQNHWFQYVIVDLFSLGAGVWARLSSLQQLPDECRPEVIVTVINGAQGEEGGMGAWLHLAGVEEAETNLEAVKSRVVGYFPEDQSCALLCLHGKREAAEFQGLRCLASPEELENNDVSSLAVIADYAGLDALPVWLPSAPPISLFIDVQGLEPGALFKKIEEQLASTRISYQHWARKINGFSLVNRQIASEETALP